MNMVSSIGSFLLGLSTLPFLYNVYVTARRGRRVTVDDPWGYARSLEWATSCPPPRHNFTFLPRIRSESPAFDLHHPEIARLEYPTTNEGRLAQALGGPDLTRREEATG
ncbi:putative cytochrome c oxidase subunit 1-alpha [Carbonactinospora thermoautotrophica]|uniref:Putative cytochrome c oxidase subunit 1-alpha n=2 Tax=Carbonactinospora thermoautotrophica TaxID=1469144 RepID=A0A132MUQ9_9ACTN|nr:putative cytochrome c oxidase subunit 1-alpha [Carbonactinospora thermoautotrophica]